MRVEGLLIVTRISLAEWHRRRPIQGYETRVPVLGLSHRDVAARYRGFDGEPWGERDWESEYPFLPESGVGELGEFPQIKEVLSRDFGPDSDLVYIGGIEPPAGLPDGFSFCGYDYGNYESVWGYYSVIHNEIIYGLMPEMRAFARYLNANLIFPSVAEAEELDTVRRELLRKGAPLEDDTYDWYPVGVWLYVGGDGGD